MMGGFRVCGMNATEMGLKTGQTRLKRIKTVSRIVRYLVLANLVFNVFFWVLYFPNPMNTLSETAKMNPTITMHGVLITSSGFLMFFWFWKLAQLFKFYERGLIFAEETIRCIKVLGIICVCGWLMMAALHFVPRPDYMPFQPPQPPPGSHRVIVSVVSHPYHLGFFSFDFGTGLDFGLLFVSASVVLAAWIMDEGRKIQEEQALTV